FRTGITAPSAILPILDPDVYSHRDRISLWFAQCDRAVLLSLGPLRGLRLRHWIVRCRTARGNSRTFAVAAGRPACVRRSLSYRIMRSRFPLVAGRVRYSFLGLCSVAAGARLPGGGVADGWHGPV